jgi:two-component system response regulator VicR
MKSMKVLVIEDDRAIVDAISLAFKIRWPEAKIVATDSGEAGIELAETENPALVILDLRLVDIDGFEVLKQIRLFSTVPILILTVRSEEADIVKGLEWGADDYMVKPFRQLELLSRVKALTRRGGSLIGEESLVCGKLHFNTATGQLYLGDKEINLTRTESRIIQHLMRNSGHLVTHSSLAESVWSDDYPNAAEALRVHIRHLREKLEDDPARPQIILTQEERATYW